MKKFLREDCRSISIYKLNEWGYLKPNESNYFSISWKNGDGEETGKVDAMISLNKNNQHITISYRIRRNGTDWKEVSQKYNIIEDECFYGGKRYWFECTLNKNGQYCGHRVAKLYLPPTSDFFACRHCHELSYESKNSRIKHKWLTMNEHVKSLKKRYYKGIMTKKFKRYLKSQTEAIKELESICPLR